MLGLKEATPLFLDKEDIILFLKYFQQERYILKKESERHHQKCETERGGSLVAACRVDCRAGLGASNPRLTPELLLPREPADTGQRTGPCCGRSTGGAEHQRVLFLPFYPENQQGQYKSKGPTEMIGVRCFPECP